MTLDTLRAAAQNAFDAAIRAAEAPRTKRLGPDDATWDDGYLNGIKACGTVMMAALAAAPQAAPSPERDERAALQTPQVGHSPLQALIDSIEVVDVGGGPRACWDYMAMYAVRDALAAASPEHSAEPAQAAPSAADNGGRTGHPPGMLQDDSRELSNWLADKPDAKAHARDAAVGIAQAAPSVQVANRAALMTALMDNEQLSIDQRSALYEMLASSPQASPPQPLNDVQRMHAFMAAQAAPESGAVFAACGYPYCGGTASCCAACNRAAPPHQAQGEPTPTGRDE